MWARRCSLGCETWPDQPLYSKCLVCGEPTARFSNAGEYEIVSAEEAKSMLLHQQFETYYARRCAARSVPADGPLPEHYLDTFKTEA